MYLGIDVGGTNLVAGLVDQNGQIRHKAARPVDRSCSDQMLSRQLADLACRAAEEAGYPLTEIQAVGIGSPGLVDQQAGVVIRTTNMPFRNTPLAEIFRSRLDVPVYLGNDADCAAVGEYWAGAAKGCDPALMITLGTGIGGGMIQGGKLYTGFGGIGMEVGHMMLHPGGLPCGCGNRGCWEQYGSATALIRMTREAMETNRDSLLWQVCSGDSGKVEGRTPFQAAGQGDETARRVLEDYLDHLAAGLIGLSNILFPQVICLGGGVSGAPEELLLNPLRQRVHQGCFDKSHLPRIERASLGNDAGVVGAAMLCQVM